MKLILIIFMLVFVCAMVDTIGVRSYNTNKKLNEVNIKLDTIIEQNKVNNELLNNNSNKLDIIIVMLTQNAGDNIKLINDKKD